MVYLLALGSALLYGAADFLGGLSTRRVGTIPVVFVSHVGGLVSLMLILPLLPHAGPTAADLWWGGAAGLASGVGAALLYRALAIGTMAIVAPVTAVCAVAIPVAFALLLGERPLPLVLLGMGLGVVSIVLVSQHRPADPTPVRTGRLPRSVGTAIAAGVTIGLFYLAIARTRTEAGLWPLVVARVVSVTLFGGVALAGRRSIVMPLALAAMVIACGATDMAANTLYMLAARLGPLSIAVTLSSLYPASTVLLARAVLKERLIPLQVWGVVCAMAAVVLIVRGGS